MRVLVTGASGFLGSHVVEALRARGDEPIALCRPGRPRPHLERAGIEVREGDLLDERSLRRAVRGADALVHCAARMGLWSRIATEQRRVNVEGTSALYRAAHAAHVARIVHVSTVGAIGCNRDGTLLTESHSFNPRALRVPYVVTKHESEQRAFAAAWAGMHVVVVNPGALFGPRFDDRPPSALMTRIAARRTRWIPPGGATICDVEDVARATVAALERGRKGERYILGGHNLEWSALYAAIARVVGAPPPTWRIPRVALAAMVALGLARDVARISRPPWTTELFRSWGWYVFVDSTKAIRELGYAIRPLEETLRRSAACTEAASISGRDEH